MYVSLCSVLPPENWNALLPNKENSLLYFTYFTALQLTDGKRPMIQAIYGFISILSKSSLIYILVRLSVFFEAYEYGKKKSITTFQKPTRALKKVSYGVTSTRKLNMLCIN